MRLLAAEPKDQLHGPHVAGAADPDHFEGHRRAGIRLARRDDGRPAADPLVALRELQDRIVDVDPGGEVLVASDRGEVLGDGLGAIRGLGLAQNARFMITKPTITITTSSASCIGGIVVIV